MLSCCSQSINTKLLNIITWVVGDDRCGRWAALVEREASLGMWILWHFKSSSRFTFGLGLELFGRDLLFWNKLFDVFFAGGYVVA